MIKLPDFIYNTRFNILAFLLCWLYLSSAELRQKWNLWIKFAQTIDPYLGTPLSGPFTTLMLSIVVSYTAVWLISKTLLYAVDKLTEVIHDFREKLTTRVITGNTRSTRSLLRRLYDSKVGVAGILYTLSQVRTTSVIIAQMTVLSSLLDIKEMVWSSLVNNLVNRGRDITIPAGAEEATEHGIEEIIPSAALFATVTNFEVGDVKIENFMGRLASNQRNADTIWKSLKPTLISLGLLKNSQYEAVIEIANTVATLSEEEAWLKFNLSHSPVTLLSGNSQVRIKKLEKEVPQLLKRLTTVATKELQNDKGVMNCLARLKSIEELLIRVQSIQNSCEFRVKPVGLCIQGEKQVGKTSMVQLLRELIADELIESGNPAFVNARSWGIWSRQCRDDFDTNYRGQEITYSDDAFQQKDNADHLLWYSFISGTAVGTNQADLHNKGMPYTSKLVITTCNNLPTTSITVNDITALHARFPFTVRAYRNNRSMPSFGLFDKSYNWLDLYVGPMEKMIDFEPPMHTRIQGLLPAGITKVTVKELAQMVAKALIAEEKFFNSRLPPQPAPAAEHIEIINIDVKPSGLIFSNQRYSDFLGMQQDRVLANGMVSFNIQRSEIFSGLYHGFESKSSWLEILRRDLPEIRAVRENKDMMQMIGDYVERNSESFLSFLNLQVLKRSNGDLELFKKKLIRSLTAVQSLSGDNETENTEDIPESLIDYMIAKIYLEQCAAIQSARWDSVSDWVSCIRRVDSKQPFFQHFQANYQSVSEFITNLDDWEIIEGKEEEFRMKYSHQLPIALDNNIWSPLFKGGKVVIPAMDIKRGATTLTGATTSTGEVKCEILLQGGLQVDQIIHDRLIHNINNGHELNDSALFLPPLEVLARAIQPMKQPIVYPTIASLVQKEQAVKKSSINMTVFKKEVEKKYESIKAFNKALSTSGMGKFISLLDSLGLPVNEYWRETFMENADIIVPAAITLATCAIIFGIVRLLQSTQATEHSANEKQPGKKQLKRKEVMRLTRKLPKAAEHNDLRKQKVFNTPKIDVDAFMEQLEEALEEQSKATVLVLNVDGVQTSGHYEAEGYLKYENNRIVKELHVSREREQGLYYIKVVVADECKFDDLEHKIADILKTCEMYPTADSTLEIEVEKFGEDQVYFYLEYYSLNARLNGSIRPWTRRELANLQNLQTALAKSEVQDLEAIVLGGVEHGEKINQEIATASSLIKHNLVQIEVANADQWEIPSGLRTLGLAHRNLIIFPAHIAKHGKYFKFYLAKSTNNRNYYVARKTLEDIERDVAIAVIVSYDEVIAMLGPRRNHNVPTFMSREKRTFPSIDNLLLNRETMSDAFLGHDSMHYFHKGNCFMFGRTTGYDKVTYKINESYIDKQLISTTPKLIAHLSHAVAGDCGGPTFLVSGPKRGALLGFYVQQTDTNWFSAYLVKEDLAEDAVVQSYEDPWRKLIINAPPEDLPNGPELKYVGRLVRPTLPASSVSLDHWKKSPFSKFFKEQLAPGRLDPNDPFIEVEVPKNQIGRKSLLMKPNSLMGLTLPELDQQVLDICVSKIIEEMTLTFEANGFLKPVAKDIPSMLQYALNGSPDNKFVRGMEVKKAAGVPWSLIGCQRKCDMIDIDEQGVRSFKKNPYGQALLNRVTEKLNQAKLGNRILSFSNSKLKDQCIKIAQAKAGRTRVFQCVPVDSILFSAALFGPFKEAFTRSGLKCYHAVGIDPKSRDWEYLVNYLCQHQNFFDADYSNYDKYLHRQILLAVRKIQRKVIQNLAPDDWDIARQVEELDTTDTLIVDYATIYQTNRANKSGSYMTTIDNCIANDLYGFYAWIKITGNDSLTEYRENVCTVSFGDDIIKSVSDKYKDKYNYLTYKVELEKLGHIITPGAKDGVERAITSLDQLQFLKRGFAQHDGYWIAPLLKRSIEGPFHWTTIDNSSYAEWKNLCQEQLIEAALHGKEYYEQFRYGLKQCEDKGLLEAIKGVLLDTWENTLEKLFTERYV
uniref:Replication polyprotein n=1 Tax=Ceratitis capitata TaxID=7213 RepID=W8B124_CERCA